MRSIDYVRILAKGWWIILLATAAGVGGALLFASRTTPTYRTRVQVVIAAVEEVPSPEAAFEITRTIDAAKVATFADLASSNEYLAEAAHNVGVDGRAAKAYTVTAIPSLQGYTVEVHVEGPDPGLTAQLASEVVWVAGQHYSSLYPGFSARVVDEPRVPWAPVTGTTTFIMGLGAALGLGAGILIALAVRMPQPVTQQGKSSPRPARASRHDARDAGARAQIASVVPNAAAHEHDAQQLGGNGRITASPHPNETYPDSPHLVTHPPWGNGQHQTGAHDGYSA